MIFFIHSHLMELIVSFLNVHLSQTSDGWSNWSGCGRSINPCSSSNYSLASFATPNANTSALHGFLAAESAGVFAVLGDFNFLHHLPEWGTITSPILSDDSKFLCTFCLKQIIAIIICDIGASFMTYHFKLAGISIASRLKLERKQKILLIFNSLTLKIFRIEILFQFHF